MKYYETNTEVTAFRIDYTFSFAGINFKAGDYMVIKDGQAKLLSGEEFRQTFSEVKNTANENPFKKFEYLNNPNPPTLIPNTQPITNRPWWDQVICNSEVQLNANNIS